MRKYEITKIAHPANPKLHKIRALTDVGTDVHKGDFGGYVESEDNLDQNGNCWIYNLAVACEDAHVSQDAVLRGCAIACGSPYLGGHVVVADSAVVRDDAVVVAGKIFGNAQISGDGKITASCISGLEPQIFGNASVYGSVSGNVHCCGSAIILPGTHLANPTADLFTLDGESVHVQLNRDNKSKEPEHKHHEKER